VFGLNEQHQVFVTHSDDAEDLELWKFYFLALCNSIHGAQNVTGISFWTLKGLQRSVLVLRITRLRI
jgi:hypothetical protein